MTELEARVRGVTWAGLGALAAVCLWGALAPAVWAQGQPTAAERAATRAADRSAVRSGDHIVAIVNQELVTAVEVSRRLARAQEDAQRSGARLPPPDELRRQVLDSLIEERVILTHARETGGKVDDGELDRAVQAVAAQNQLNVQQLRERLAAEGIDLTRFRANLRDQLLVERTREREVYQRIRLTDSEVEDYLERQRRAASAEAPLNLAQILISVPPGAPEAVVAERRRLAEAALARVRAGEPFEAVARQVSEDAQREQGGEIGARPASRLPDLFVEATRALKPGEITPALVRSGAAFHVLKVLSRGDVGPAQVTQTRARHILLRTSSRLTADAAQARLAGYRRQIESGARTFEDMAREFSEDGSAAQGGDLGWASPGTMVPEFEEAMNALPLGGLSQPVVSRFGVHLIQVMQRRDVAVDPRQLREQARNALREQRFDDAYAEWARDLRGRAYVEMREPPL
jgi:peptidyl-prolyl cis-trans isomerase SurA